MVSRAVAAGAFFFASLTAMPSAYAQNDRAQTPREPPHDSRRPVAVTFNPLGFAVQRYGANLEIIPIPHHAFVGTAFFESVPLGMLKSVSGFDAINDNHGAAFGGEIGYRLYMGRVGADGFFAGASFITMPLVYPRVAADLASADLVRFNAQGAAFDIGIQKVTDVGFTIGGGVGVMYLAYELPNDLRRIPLPMEPHILPRLLLTAGWSF
jgi:hypothetical protein